MKYIKALELVGAGSRSNSLSVPIVGVPTAEILNDVADKAQRANQREPPVLVYDHIGIRDTWNAHLRWLDEQIRAVRAIKVSEAGWALAGWEA